MSLRDDCLELFGHSDLYLLFQVKKDSTQVKIKQGYRKMSLMYHPDRFSGTENESHKLEATRKFQVVTRAYRILEDARLREQYDATGLMGEDDSISANTDWASLWRSMFPQITKEDIDKFMAEFRGSDREIKDLKEAYIKYKGNLDKISESVIGFDSANEERFREIIWTLIDNGEVEPYDTFINEPASRCERRRKREIREAKEAKKAQKELKEKHGTDDLYAMIQQNNAARKQQWDSMCDKYNKPQSRKRKATDE